MQCLNPIIAYKGDVIGNYNIDVDTGEKKSKIFGFHNLKKAYSIFGTEYMNEVLHRKGLVLLPCRKCVNCQLNRSREWAIRNSLEAKEYDDDSKIMLTLTYDDDHVPLVNLKEVIKDDNDSVKNNRALFTLQVGTLCPKDVQGFLKRLRSKFEDFKIRYYLVGEYGGQTLRPHYHILLYGLPLRKSVIEDLDYLYTSNKNDYYNSEIIAELWGKGFVNITGFSDYTAMYVSRYCTKKQDSSCNEWNYSQNNSLVYNNFNLMSRRPGIAYKYFINNKDEIYKDDSFIYHIDGKTWELKPIKYFDRQYDIENPKHMKFIKENRQKFYKNYEYFEALKTNLQLDEYLDNESRVQNKYLKKRSL